MTKPLLLSAWLFIGLLVGGSIVVTDPALAQGTVSPGEASAEERAAILAALNLPADPQGQVTNACDERVNPRFFVADLGSGPGRVIAVDVGGGPNMPSCYGDGTLLVLMRNTDGAWNKIWKHQGGGAIILSTQHKDGNDIAAGGPGFAFPVWEWNGTAYVDANRTVADSALGEARFVPN